MADFWTDELGSDVDEEEAERLYRDVAYDPENHQEAIYRLGVLLRKKAGRGENKEQNIRDARRLFLRNYNHYHHRPSMSALHKLDEEILGSSLPASRAGIERYESNDDDSDDDDSDEDDFEEEYDL